MGREPAGGADDPFEHVVLDDSFVRNAERRELSAQERSDRAVRAAQEEERLAFQRMLDEHQRRPVGRARAAFRPGSGVVTALAVLLVMALVGASVLRKGQDAALWASGPAFRWEAEGTRPTPRAAPSTSSLLAPTAEVTPGAEYKFLTRQLGGDGKGVTYDPCRPIPVVVNNRTAPAGAQQLVEEALAQVSAAAGLRFVYEGVTDEVPAVRRPAYQPDRYGDRWAPVLIAWSDEKEWSLLGGNIAGTGGSASIQVDEPEAKVYVTGEVVLDGPDLARLVASQNGFASARAVVLHELGHLIGLDHVDDTSQLMSARGGASTTFGPGDLTGIAFLRAGAPCVKRL